MEISRVEGVDITGVSRDVLDIVWPDIAPFVEQALARGLGEYALEDIYQAISDSSMQLWVIAQDYKLLGALVTEICIYPRKKIGVIVLAAGIGAKDMVKYPKEIEDWFYEMGCDYIFAQGRRGWVREGKKFGWREQYTVIVKELRANDEDLH